MWGLQRAVGALVLGAAMAGAGLVWWSVSDQATAYADRPPEGVVLGAWEVLYDTAVPTTGTLAAACGIALLLAAGVAALERRFSDAARRSADRFHRPLAPQLVMADTRGVFHGDVTLTVLIPAHDEEGCLAATLESLLGQSRRPERVIVVADNCTDDTVAIAEEAGVEVFETSGNTDKKAGGAQPGARRAAARAGRERPGDGHGRRHRPRRRVPGGGGAADDRRPRADGDRRPVPR
ncbi:glycosyltransferase [Nocardioides sp. TF02-7]|uniref:glycosyltransferase n=1 Tax=Nocardioides sp. TF02-7 TaxID=2917724 RepID=UPI001F050B0D|nr:glycosyltransferase [Nocardioides sp. TF02-7]UMG91904.1 glycosyltransferase [Nocardioides sp. TF02-7]